MVKGNFSYSFDTKPFNKTAFDWNVCSPSVFHKIHAAELFKLNAFQSSWLIQQNLHFCRTIFFAPFRSAEQIGNLCFLKLSKQMDFLNEKQSLWLESLAMPNLINAFGDEFCFNSFLTRFYVRLELICLNYEFRTSTICKEIWGATLRRKLKAAIF